MNAGRSDQQHEEPGRGGTASPDVPHGDDVPEAGRRRVPGWARPWRLAYFLCWYFWQLVLSNAYVAWEVVTPRQTFRPGIIAVPVRSRTPVEVTTLANLITLTPGTISVDVDERRAILYVHGMHIQDPDSFRARTRRLEDQLLRVLR